VENEFGEGVQQHWFEQFSSPITFVHASDDEIATLPNVEDIMRLFTKASKKRLEIKPEMFKLGKVGHIDIFRERCNSIWPQILAELTPAH
jgi:predicted alpha/beta hydrolase